MTTVLAAHGVTYAIGATHILDDVSVAVQTGELLAIVGPNGAGKSTLLRLLAGDLQPSAGSIELRGHPLASVPVAALARERAVMPQHKAISYAFTVDDVVAMGRHPWRAGRERDTAAVVRAMRLCEIDHLRDRAYPTLSGGEQQRVTFARVLAQEAPLLLLDEPTSSLDIAHQEHVMAVARTIAHDGGAVVAVLHDLNLAAWYADRICLLGNGVVVADGAPESILEGNTLSHVYSCPLVLHRDPGTGAPVIQPVRERRPVR